jgi:transcriptional regulator with XRE-family HTH domain
MDDSEKVLRERLGQELRKARMARGLTQNEVAERLETDPETISRFERGATLPSLVRLLTLAEALDVSVATLLGAASPRATDEIEDLRHALASLPPKDRKLATAVMRAVVGVWKQ